MKFIIIFIFLFNASDIIAQEWEDCCWKKMKSGLEIKIIEKGKGEKLKDGDIVRINSIWYEYETGKILINYLLDFSSGTDWEVGSNSYVKGFEEGLKKLRRGGKAFIKIPPELAYGTNGLHGQKTFCYFITILEN